MEDDKFKHQKRYEAEMRAKGFRRVAVWIPIDYKRELQVIAEEMRDEFIEQSGVSGG